MIKITEYTENGIVEIVRPCNDIIQYRGDIGSELKEISNLPKHFPSDKKTDTFLRDLYAEEIANGYNVKSRSTGKLLLTKEWGVNG